MGIKSVLFGGLMIFSLTSSVQDVEKVSADMNDQTLELNTEGLYYAEFFDYIFRGHFENIEMTREELQFSMIFEQYLRAFGSQCPDVLPDDKVEIMEDVCAMEEVTTNGYGIETSRICVQWRTVGTGLYARPELYSAKLAVERLQSAEALRTTINMITDPNAMGNSIDMVHKAKGLKNDMAQIFGLNPCSGAAIRRFEENLRLFALGKPSIRMKEPSKYAEMKKSGGPSGEQNFDKLIDDLVSDQAKTWAFNRYISGSISNIKKYANSKGVPSELIANYSYKGFSGSSAGSVRITFDNGLPKCIYFFDFPNNCKSPNSGILASYAKGDYTK
ncbi:hypothetical protein [Flagellimonas flava]|uniref:hypothetical protein n=1 Tax=Flagellimonas flava TaxID=570519 RepID=UPI003D662D92